MKFDSKFLLAFFASLLVVASCCSFGTAQTSVDSTRVQIVPEPRQVTPTGERFKLNPSTKIVLANRKSDDDRFAVQDFIDDIRATANISLSIGGSGKRRVFVGPLSDRRIREALNRVGLHEPQAFDKEGYLLSVTEHEIVIGGKTTRGTFYGVQTLKQLVRDGGSCVYVQGAKIVDWPAMRWRGVSDDVSRGPVPTVEYVKRQIRTFASFKLNMHALYMEHTFATASHPLIGPEGGSFTAEELKELSDYARRYHIELVPQLQTFGHLHGLLKIEKYNELAETPYGEVLSPQREETYKLIADWYRELNQAMPGKFFHIGADEVSLGKGQSRDAVKEKGPGAVYFDHLRRVRSVLQPYNRQLMFWGDIALHHPELIGSIPKDMIVMNWTYRPVESYADRIKLFKDAGLSQFVCPGVQGWREIFPNNDAAVVNILNFVRDGQAAGAMGMSNTHWDDDGETLFEMSWYGIVLGAASSWQSSEFDLKQFERNFDWTFFRAEGDEFVHAYRALGSVNTLMNVGATDTFFWQEPFTDAFQAKVRELNAKAREMRLRVENAEETLLRKRGRIRRNGDAIEAMIFAARRFDHMGRRMQVVEHFSRDYWDAYLNLNDKQRVMRLRWRHNHPSSNTLREMAEELSLLKDQYHRQWLAENRPYWLDSILARYDYAIQTWLAKSKQLEEALREYEKTSTLPDPRSFGVGERPPDR